MKVAVIINIPYDAEKTNKVYKCIEHEAKIRNVQVNIEVQGLINQESKLTKETIQQSDGVIIISDVSFSKDRFNNKTALEVSSNRAIENTDWIFEEIFKMAKKNNITDKKTDISYTQIVINPKTNSIYKHLQNGAFAMIPLIITGGILTAITYLFGLDTGVQNEFKNAILNIAMAVFALVVPILSGFIAYSISDKAGLGAGLVGGVFAYVLGAGFLGGIITGFLAGYISKWIIKYVKLPNKFDGFKFIVLAPFVSITIIGLGAVFIADPLVTMIYEGISVWIKDLSVANLVLLGAVIGLFVAFDIGGAFSKATLGAAFALVGTGLLIPQASAIAASMVPPLGLALAVAIAKHNFTVEEREAGKAAWILGVCGITEGAIPFAVKDPLKVIPSVMVGSAVTGALTALFGCSISLQTGGLLIFTVPGMAAGIGGILVSVVIGMIITALLITYLKS